MVKKIANWMKRAGTFESNSREKKAMPVGFKVPETLEAQMARIVRSEMNRQKAHLARQSEEDDDVEDDGPISPHELVVDKETGHEMTRWEKDVLDKDRAVFDEEVKRKKAEYAARRKPKQPEAKKEAPKEEPKK